MDIEKDPRHPFRKIATVTENEILVGQSDSLYSTGFPNTVDGSWRGGPAWPDLAKWQPQSEVEHKAVKTTIKILALNLGYLLFPALYIALGILVLTLSGHPIFSGSPTFLPKIESDVVYFGIQQAITVSVTLFPILFSIVLFKTIKTTAQYKAERGTTILQLMASKSVGSAALGPLNFKRINGIGILLLSLWLLSPITTQSLQRMFSYGIHTIKTTQMDVWYLNAMTPYPGIFFESTLAFMDSYGPGLEFNNDLFNAQMLQPDTSSSIDIYGNPRVPLFSDVKADCPPSLGYYPVAGVPVFGLNLPTCEPGSRRPLGYSSSLGVPIAGLLPNTTSFSRITNLKIQTSYWTFSCSPWIQLSALEVHETYNSSDNPWTSSNCVSEAAEFEDKCHLTDPLASFFFHVDPGSKDTYSRIVFGSKNYAGAWHEPDGVSNGVNGPAFFGVTTCDLRAEEVDATIACAGTSCSVVGMEQSRPSVFIFGPDVKWDEKSWSGGFTSQRVMMALAQDILTENAIPYTEDPNRDTPRNISSVFESWLYNPATVSGEPNSTHYANLSTLSIPLFEQRLAFLWNTLYQANLEPTAFTMQHPSKFPIEGYSETYKNTTADVFKQQLTYEAHAGWVAALFLSCVVVIGVIAANTYMQTRLLGPEILGYVSSMTQSNQYIPLPPGGSNLGGMERTLMLADLRVRLQDVYPDRDVGHIALSSVAGRPLESGRKYS